MNVDYLIIGQGICGTLLSRELLRAGKTLMVVDNENPWSSSKVAGGIINPITGMRMVRSWMVDQLHPFALDTYNEISEQVAIPVVRHCSILDFHATNASRDAFDEKLHEEKQFLSKERDDDWMEYFRFNYGIGKIAPCLLVDIRSMLSGWHDYLVSIGSYRNTSFAFDECIINSDSVMFKDITAGKIIFCNGVQSVEDPFFEKLPWSKDKGEALIVSIPGLPQNQIFRQGSINIVPWQNGLFWIGATHDWKFTDMEPTQAYRNKVEEQLRYWLKIPFAIQEHLVSQRPANVDRKPFVGLHPLRASVGIFNGMGSKGCSVAPYFARQFAQHLVHGSSISPEVDVKRYTKILSRLD